MEGSVGSRACLASLVAVASGVDVPVYPIWKANSEQGIVQNLIVRSSYVLLASLRQDQDDTVKVRASEPLEDRLALVEHKWSIDRHSA